LTLMSRAAIFQFSDSLHVSLSISLVTCTDSCIVFTDSLQPLNFFLADFGFGTLALDDFDPVHLIVY